MLCSYSPQILQVSLRNWSETNFAWWYVRARVWFEKRGHRSVPQVKLMASGVNGLPFEVLIKCHGGWWDLWLSCISPVHLKTDSVDPGNTFTGHFGLYSNRSKPGFLFFLPPTEHKRIHLIFVFHGGHTKIKSFSVYLFIFVYVMKVNGVQCCFVWT